MHLDFFKGHLLGSQLVQPRVVELFLRILLSRIFRCRFSRLWKIITISHMFILLVREIILVRMLSGSLEIKALWLVLCSLSEVYQLFVIAGLILSCHVIIGFLLFLVHMRPFWANMAHNFIWRPLWVKFFQFFPVFLAEVDIRGQRLFGSGEFSLSSHIRA